MILYVKRRKKSYLGQIPAYKYRFFCQLKILVRKPFELSGIYLEAEEIISFKIQIIFPSAVYVVETLSLYALLGINLDHTYKIRYMI